jgi:hypothetical protein
MYRLALLVALSAAACGSLDDDRPATFPYIQAAIINPTCAKAQCHSTFAQEDGQNYGSIDATRQSWILGGWVIADVGSVLPEDDGVIVICTHGITSTFTNTTVRMPYDEPMPAEDIKLIERWIATTDPDTGLGAIGAQCVPNAQGTGCFDNEPVPCSPDGNVTSLTPVMMCAQNETCSVEAGTCVSN